MAYYGKMGKSRKSTKSNEMLNIFRSLKTTTKKTKYGTRAMFGVGTMQGHKVYALRFKSKNGRSVTKLTMID